MDFDFSVTNTNPGFAYFSDKGNCNYQSLIDATIIKAKHAKGEVISIPYKDPSGKPYMIKAAYMVQAHKAHQMELLKAGKLAMLFHLYEPEFSNIVPVLHCVMTNDACYIHSFNIKTAVPNTTVANINCLLRAANYQEAFCNDTRNTRNAHAFCSDEVACTEGQRKTFDVSNTITVGYRPIGNEIERHNTHQDAIIHPEDIYEAVKDLSTSEIYSLIVNYKVYSRELFVSKHCYGLKVYNTNEFMDIFQPWFNKERDKLIAVCTNANTAVVMEQEYRCFLNFIDNMCDTLLGGLEETTEWETLRLWHDHQCWPLLYTSEYGDIVLQAIYDDKWYYKMLTMNELLDVILQVKHSKNGKPLDAIDMTDDTYTEYVHKITLFKEELDL